MFLLIFFALLQTTANCSDKDRIDQISKELAELQVLQAHNIKKRLPVADINQSIEDLLNKLPANRKVFHQQVLPNIINTHLESLTTLTTPAKKTDPIVPAQPQRNADTDIKIHGMIATFFAFEKTVMNNQKS